jgi:hypothetical protein
VLSASQRAAKSSRLPYDSPQEARTIPLRGAKTLDSSDAEAKKSLQGAVTLDSIRRPAEEEIEVEGATPVERPSSASEESPRLKGLVDSRPAERKAGRSVSTAIERGDWGNTGTLGQNQQNGLRRALAVGNSFV